VLFHGPSGTGKSLLLSQLSSAPWKQVVKIDQQVKNAASIHKIFESAIANQPSLVIIDRLDTIAPSGSRDAQNVNPLSVQLQEDLKGIQGKKILVVAATKALYHVDEELLRPDAFLWEIEFPVPGADARIEILRYIAKEQNLDIANDVSESIARRAHGFVGEDLLRLCEYAGYHAELRNEHKGGERKTNGETVPSMEQVDGSELLLQVTIEDLESALVKARPASIREIHVQKPNVRWTDVGGYDYIKKAMSNVLERPLKRPDVVASYKLEPDKGVLFYGPPGCSKTLCAKAIATESDYNFISVKGAELLSMYVGESERALRDVFYKARNASPSIIFFDEFDSIGASRNSSSQGSGLHVLTTLLTEMDGIVALKGVLVIAATNRPESLDQALLRRFINRIYVGPPDFRSRKEILGIRLKDLPLAEDVRLEELSEQTEGYSGAEIVDICSKAKNTTADRYTEKEEQNAPLELISRADFQNAIDSTAKVITPKMISFYEDWSTGSLTNR
ncbi:AAA-domain-containing protein, partial [Patellaria atrata CBS 101060]